MRVGQTESSLNPTKKGQRSGSDVQGCKEGSTFQTGDVTDKGVARVEREKTSAPTRRLTAGKMLLRGKNAITSVPDERFGETARVVTPYIKGGQNPITAGLLDRPALL